MMIMNSKNTSYILRSQKSKALNWIFLGIIFLYHGCDQNPNDGFEKIADSHINANVPTDEKFDELLKRDLKSFIKFQYKQDCSIEHHLLRKGPTQVGVAYPKFYIWVTAKYREEKVAEGAMRVAAINKLQFEVTHFVTIDEIRSKPDIINSIFPGPVCERIIGIIKEKS